MEDANNQTTPLDNTDPTPLVDKPTGQAGQADDNKQTTEEIQPTPESLVIETTAESAPEVFPSQPKSEALPVEPVAESAPLRQAPADAAQNGALADKQDEPEVLPSQAEHEVLPVETAPAPVEQETNPPTEPDMARDSIAPQNAGLQNDSVENEAGIMARVKMFLKDKLLAANRKRREKAAASLEMIMSYTREHGKITNDEVERLVKVKDRQALNYLSELVKQGRLVRFGTKKNTFYKAVN